MKKPFDWRIFWILWAAATFGLVAIVPYSLALQANALKNARLPLPLPILATIQVAEQVILFAFATAAGLYFANRTGLGLPLLQAKLRGEAIRERVLAMLPLPVVLGILGALAIAGLDVYLFQPLVKGALADQASQLVGAAATPAAWKGFFASFYGGIDEEILLRLFVMSLLAWLGHFISKRLDGRPTLAVLWIANILAAVLFGVAHLPTVFRLMAQLPDAAAAASIAPVMIARTIALNGLLGIVYGYLYFTRGLESAMASHFCSDLILHVLFAL